MYKKRKKKWVKMGELKENKKTKGGKKKMGSKRMDELESSTEGKRVREGILEA